MNTTNKNIKKENSQNKSVQKLLAQQKKMALSIALILACQLPSFSQNKPQSPAKNEQHAIELDSAFLHFFDGQQYGINAQSVGDMLQVRLRLKIMLYGTETNNKQYRFRDKKYTMKEMALTEMRAEKNYKNYLSSKTTYDTKTQKLIEAEHAQLQKELQASLLEAKEDFSLFLLPFLQDLRPMKKHMIPLMQESCKKRGAAESLLPKCVGLADNTEIEGFKKVINSYKDLGLFCRDLINFLSDLVFSCPKARAQFEELYKTDTTTTEPN